jgi:hypothetical protein
MVAPYIILDSAQDGIGQPQLVPGGEFGHVGDGRTGASGERRSSRRAGRQRESLPGKRPFTLRDTLSVMALLIFHSPAQCPEHVTGQR